MKSIEQHSLNFALAPFAFAYGRIMRLRQRLYSQNIFRSHTLSAPVISVGNITTGGTGKTPLVRWLVEALHDRVCNRQLSLSEKGLTPNQDLIDACICILTRGYGRAKNSNGKLERVVVSNGARITADARTGGDEPRQLAEQLLGKACVISDADRVAAAHWAQCNFNPKLFILDDGFQHLRLRRDFDLVAVNALNPFGNNRLLPRGRLREPLTALRRADAIIITRAEHLAAPDALIKQLEPYNSNIFLACTRTRNVSLLETYKHENTTARELESTIKLESTTKLRVLAFCALAEPRAFFAHLQQDNWSVSHTLAFTDHHAYTPSDIERIETTARQHQADALITTAKDAVKLCALRLTLPCVVVDIDFEIENSRDLINMILARIAEKRA